MTRLLLSIAPDHPAFAGHFPGRPILPGVVLLDESLRALAARYPMPRAGRWQVAQAKFLSFVEPGDPVRVDIAATGTADRFRVQVLAGAESDERVAMTGSIGFVADGTAR